MTDDGDWITGANNRFEVFVAPQRSTAVLRDLWRMISLTEGQGRQNHGKQASTAAAAKSVF